MNLKTYLFQTSYYIFRERERQRGEQKGEGKSKALTKSYLQKNTIAEIPALGTQGKNKWQD